MAKLTILTINNVGILSTEAITKIAIFALAIIFILILLKIFEKGKSLDEILKEKQSRNMYEAYLRAVRGGNYDRLISEEDIKFIMMSDRDFELSMLKVNADDVILFEIQKYENGTRIRQAQIERKFQLTEQTKDSKTWEIIEKELPPLPRFSRFRVGDGGEISQIQDS